MPEARYYRFFELLRQYNLRGKFTGGVYDTSLSPLEAYVVVETDAARGISINELAEILRVDRSTLSRAVSRLVRNRYLSAKIRRQDRRSKQLTVLPRGAEFLKIHDAFNASFVAKLSLGLSKADLKSLARYLDRLADGAGAAPLRLRPNEPELLRGVRRLARVWDILGGAFLQTKYSVLHWQILTEAQRARAGLRPLTLIRELNLPKSTLSEILARYRAEGLITQKRDTQDLRGFMITLTPAGRRVVQQLRTRGVRRIAGALAAWPVGEQRRFLRLFERYVVKE